MGIIPTASTPAEFVPLEQVELPIEYLRSPFLRHLVGEDWAKGIEAGDRLSALVDLAIFFASAASSMLAAIFLALVAWFFIHRNQNKALAQTATRDRLEFVYALESQIQALHSELCIFKEVQMPADTPETPDACRLELRAALDDTPWKISTPRDYKFIGARRHWQIDATGRMIDSRALHDAMICFRRTNDALKAGVVQPQDLYRMWRQILPFVCSGRYSYFRKYFASGNIYENAPLRNTVACLLAYCLQQKACEGAVPLSHLEQHVDRTPRVDKDFVKDLEQTLRFSPVELRQCWQMFFDQYRLGVGRNNAFPTQSLLDWCNRLYP